MASYRKRGEVYEVFWRDLSGRQRSRKATTAATAQHLCREIGQCIERGRDWQPEVTGREPSIGEVAKAYLAKRASYANTMRLRKNTVRGDGVYLDVFLRFMHERENSATVAVLKPSLLEDFIDWLARPETCIDKKKRPRKSGAPRRPNTIGKIVRCVQRMWVWAETQNGERWPKNSVPRPALLAKQDIPREVPDDVHPPTWDEMDACIRQCKTTNLRRLAFWLRHTGLRVGESMLFLWADIDMERGELTIRAEVDKMKKKRVVMLAPAVLDEIAGWGTREGFIHMSSRKAGVREREARGRDMARAWKRAGVREAVWKRRPDHAFRKGFKTGLLDAGAHPDVADWLQGHRAGARWQYIKISPERQREALALMPAFQPAPNVVRLPTRRAAGTALAAKI